MTEEEKEKIKQVNLDKAKNNFKWVIPIMSLIMIINCSSIILKEVNIPIYITISLVVFGIITFIVLILGKVFIEKKDEVKAKLFIMYAIIPLIMTCICDIIYGICDMNQNYSSDISRYDADIEYYFISVILEIICIILIKKVIVNLSKANDPIEYKESTDWFYERYNDDDQNK